MKNFIKNKIIHPLLLQVKQGVTPQKLSMSLAVGATIGVMPLLGPPTPLCVLAGIVFKLNHVALQVGNYVVYGLQLILIPVFLKYGDLLFKSQPFSLSPEEIKATISTMGVWGFTQKFAFSLLHGSVLWLALSPLIVFVLYFLLFPFLKKVQNANK